MQMSSSSRDSLNVPQLRLFTLGTIALAFVVEVVAGYVDRNALLPKVVPELLSALALALLAGTAMFLIFRLRKRPLLKILIVAATLLMFFAQVLEITHDLRFLDGVPLIGSDATYHAVTRGLSMLAGILLMLVTAFLAMIEAVAAERRLARERKELAREVEVRRQAELELKKSREELRDLSEHIEMAREAERKRIAREVHDELGQTLTILRLDLSALEHELQGKQSPEVTDLLNTMSNAIGNTMASVRRIIAELRPSILDDLGLVAAVDWQAREFSRRTGITCTLDASGHTGDVSPEQATALFRILQEGLTNVARHSGAMAVHVEMKDSPDGILLSIRDNGHGVSNEDREKKDSFGLLGVRERARQLLGEVSFESGSEGSLLQITLPRDPSNRPEAPLGDQP